MSKKIINISISIFLVIISFFYTNKVISIFKEKDPIMLEIKKYSQIYGDTMIDSVLVNNDLIPGVKGIKVDIDKSYKKMKRTGKFDKNLLVFNESVPSNNLKNNYSNYIISLNKNQNNVSIIFELNNIDNLQEILSILNNKNVKVTFFITKDIFENNIDLVNQIIKNNNEVELLSESYSIYEVNKYNSILKLLTNNKLNFCLNESKDDELLKKCESSKLYSIVPSIKITNGLYNSVKNNLENGMIISLPNTKKIVKELSSTINYIEQKGKKIILLNKILES